MGRLECNSKEVKTSDGSSVMVLEMSGSVDPETVPQFKSELDNRVEAGNIRLLLDFTNLKYINSTGLGALVAVNDSLESHGGKVIIMAVQPKVSHVLAILGMQDLFTFVEDIDEGLTAFTAANNQTAEDDKKPVEVNDYQHTGIYSSLSGTTPAPIASQSSVESEDIACPICKVALAMPLPNVCACPRCGSVLRREGNTWKGNPVRTGNTLDITIPAAENWIPVLQEMAKQASKFANLTEEQTNKICAMIAEAAKSLLKAAADIPEFARLRAMIEPESDKLTIHAFCLGSTITREDIASWADNSELEVNISSDRSGNLLTISC